MNQRLEICVKVVIDLLKGMGGLDYHLGAHRNVKIQKTVMGGDHFEKTIHPPENAVHPPGNSEV